MSNCENCTSESAKFDKLAKVIEKFKGTAGALIPTLHEAQEIFGYLPMSVQKKVSEGLDISLGEVYGVVTFYTQFTIYPKGENVVSVCLGTACYVKGANDIADEFKKELGIDVGETTKDNKFSLDACRCVGACGLAPVVMVNEDVYGKITPADVKGILSKYRN